MTNERNVRMRRRELRDFLFDAVAPAAPANRHRHAGARGALAAHLDLERQRRDSGVLRLSSGRPDRRADPRSPTPPLPPLRLLSAPLSDPALLPVPPPHTPA